MNIQTRSFVAIEEYGMEGEGVWRVFETYNWPHIECDLDDYIAIVECDTEEEAIRIVAESV
jgi:hypothetical protein